MIGLTLTLLALQVAGDTVTYDVAGALRRALEASPTMAAARFRDAAAHDRAQQAAAWANPSLTASGENFGQQQSFTGREGLAGIEGQIVLATPLPFGPERSGAIRTARALASSSSAAAEMTELDVQAQVLGAVADLLRDQAMVEGAREELGTMTRLAEALALQAASGRASRGDASRVALARGMAATALARSEVTLAESSTRVARLLDHPPSIEVRIESAVCEGSPAAVAGDPSMDAPTLRVGRARIDEAAGRVETARGLQLPDLEPQAGLRRTGGRSGLYLGLATSIPLFDRGSRRIDAARAEEDAARAEQLDLEERWVSAHAAATRAVTALTGAGAGFNTSWFEALDQTTTAAEARFQAGEGTLVELLDSRRARIQALDDYHRWTAEWQRARTEVNRLEGRALTPSLICTDPFRDDAP